MHIRPLVAGVAAAFLLGACAGMHHDASAPAAAAPAAAGPKALAVLEPTKGNGVHGNVIFTPHGDKLTVNARVGGLKPNGDFGFHIHEKGDCSSGDGMSAGGHFNPAGSPHGNSASGAPHHAGDMPNLHADANGNADVTFEVSGVGVGGGAADILGKGLIVHRDADDYASQPAGNAGPRIACAVIRPA